MEAALAGQETIEDVVLRHSKRGMTVLRGYMDSDFCKRAAQQILDLERGPSSSPPGSMWRAMRRPTALWAR